MKVYDFVKAEIELLSIKYKIAIENRNKLHANMIKNKVSYLYKITEACEETGEEAFNYVSESLKLFGLNQEDEWKS